jgi:membrane associated rhomboid family serine protease
MSQANGPTSHGIRFWMLLPLRMFLHGARYVFGHPLPFIVVFSLIGLLLFYLAALPGEPAVDGRVTAGGGNPIPGAATLAAVFGMLVGLLVIWMSEHTDRPNTVWTKAPSIWRPLDEPLVVGGDDEDAASQAASTTSGAAQRS